MSESYRHAATRYWRPMTGAEAAVVDEGLRAHMLQVYHYMGLGLGITGFAALGTGVLATTADPAAAVLTLHDGVMLTRFGHVLFVSPLKWIVMLAPLALAFVLGSRIDRLSAGAAQATFWVYAGLIGLSLESLFLVFAQTSIVRVFFIAAASFGTLSLWGYSAQRDLKGMASFLVMGLIGILAAILINLVLASSALQFVLSVAGVLVFAGLTAWETQRLKREYIQGAMRGEVAERSAILGALSLYLDVLILFIVLLQLFGQRDE